MNEINFDIDQINQVDFLGVNDENLVLIKNTFPKLKIISRGNKLKAIGDSDTLEIFHEKMNLLLDHCSNFGQLTEDKIYSILNNQTVSLNENQKRNILVNGVNGKVIKAKTPGQQKMVDLIEKNAILFAVGSAGTGKTYTAVALAVRALKNQEIKKIVLTRPAVEAGESLGFLPGDLREKIDPYLQPLYDALEDMIPVKKLMSLLELGTIEIAPLAFMRGRTLDNAYVILDEAQNTSRLQLKMFLTRMGPNAKMILTGDVTQIDLPRNHESGLNHAIKILDKIKGIGFVHLTEEDCVRHPLVKNIIRAYEQI